MTISEDMEVDPVPAASIVNHRSTRFSGEIQTCDLSELSAQSLDELRWLYQWLEALGKYSSRDLSQPTVLNEFEALVTRDSVARVIDSTRNIRAAQQGSIEVTRILHDLRGTALHQLVGIVDLWLSGRVFGGGLPAAAILARDHAKFMRHSLIGLDEQSRLLDAGRCLHGVENLRNRLLQLVFVNADGAVRIDFAANWNGEFAITCPEFSTVLRQLYNLMGNAVRHTADHTILVRVFPMGPVKPKSLRLVIANALTQADRATLSRSVLAKLWHGYTTTGSGLGLNASAALVAEAFGLECPDRAIDLGYVGSRVTENGYICWIHWPIVIQDAD
jgi:hypothetical protein